MSFLFDCKNDEHCCWLCCPRCSCCYETIAAEPEGAGSSPVTSQPNKTTELNKDLPGKEESTDAAPAGLRGPML